MLRYSLAITILLLALPLAGNAQVVPQFFVRNVPDALQGYVGCRYVSSAVEVVRQAQVAIQNGTAISAAIAPVSNCTRYQTTPAKQIVVQATLGTYRTTVSDDVTITFYIHTYRRASWRPGRLEYLVTTMPTVDRAE
jgi:hypothetical protein